MLDLDRVCFGWNAQQPVIDTLSLKIPEGDKVVILGANGCGKSTLLKLMNGLATPQSGSISYRGREPRGRDFRAACALLFQHPEAMLFNPTVREEIAYGPRQMHLPDVDVRVTHWAQALGLTALLDTPPFLLSGGEKQKVALACVLAIEPGLLLLDEPSASLDPATVGWLIDTLLDSDTTVVAATHNLTFAAELGSRCLVLGAGSRLLYDGPTEAALNNIALLEEAHLAHRHRHRQGGSVHTHPHVHDWEGSR